MKKIIVPLLLVTLALCFGISRCKCSCRKPTYRTLTVADFEERVLGGYVGKCIGVEWGMPTEFKHNETNAPMPESLVPPWESIDINKAFDNDDLYLNARFLQDLDRLGAAPTPTQIAISLANTTFPLWCANKASRDNIRRGLAPTSCAHPTFHTCGNDIDYQIEADFSGLVAPGQLDQVTRLSNLFGKLINYGDGVYAGTFIGALYSEAFFETNITQLVRYALQSIPPNSDYAQMVSNLLQWHQQYPDSWSNTYHRIVEHYAPHQKVVNNEVVQYPRDSNGGIDARLNGAMVLLGLLYGNGDFERTAILAMRGGFDSDCNPSTALGILGTLYGYKAIPKRFTEKLSFTQTFSNTDYTLRGIVRANTRVATELLLRNGGAVKGSANGTITFYIPRRKVTPEPYQPTWLAAPQPYAAYLPQEAYQQIKFPRWRLSKSYPTHEQFALQLALLNAGGLQWEGNPQYPSCIEHLPGEAYLGRKSPVASLCVENQANGVRLNWQSNCLTNSQHFLPAIAIASAEAPVRVRLKINDKWLADQTITQPKQYEAINADLTDLYGQSAQVVLQILPLKAPHARVYLSFEK